MKQVTTNVFCDSHLARNASEEVVAQSVMLVVDDEGPFSLDLCPECRNDLVEPLRKLLATYGEPVVTAVKKRTQRKTRVAAAAPEPSGPAKKKATTAKASKPASKRAKAKVKGPTAADVRAWAAENNIEVVSHGRVPSVVWDQYREAKGLTA